MTTDAEYGALVERLRRADTVLREETGRAITREGLLFKALAKVLGTVLVSAASAIEALIRERDTNADIALAQLRLVVTAEARTAKLEAGLREIVGCTHRPNPTDHARIDVAPGKHRAFQAAIDRASALLPMEASDAG